MSEVENQKAWLREFQNVAEWATKLQEFLGSEEQLRSLFPKRFGPGGDFSPKPDSKNQCRVFRAFELVEPSKVQCLVIGLDPYPYASGYATGVAFLVPKDTDPPNSLKLLTGTLFPPGTPDLERWSRDNGMLLINAALTISKDGEAGGQLADWKKFTKAIIRFLRKEKPKIEILAFGERAAKIAVGEALIKFCIHPAKRGVGEKGFRDIWGNYNPLREK